MVSISNLATSVCFFISALTAFVNIPERIATNNAAIPVTGNITMWTDDTHTQTMVKFVNVSDQYDLRDIKHVDHAGMFWTFNNGETWLTLNNKRLFLTPDYNDDFDRQEDAVEAWPIMSPKELKEALAEFPSYDEMQAQWEAVQEREKAEEAEPTNENDLTERRRTCSTARCRTSDNCYPYSTSRINCYRCHAHRCTVMTILPNAIVGGKPW